ncbi:hypothetical protein [Cohnella cellulosilytica]|uniref:Uncharacterized protein n=1 Tax=Cohnella cellulosilytica TaxID=986710 RepID=A0ABW2F6X3_9BACL
MSKRVGSILGVVFSVVCFAMATYGSRFFENGVSPFILYLFLFPAILALIGSLLNKPIINIISLIWIFPACLYFTFGPLLIILHVVAIVFMFIDKKSNVRNKSHIPHK